MRIWLVAPLLLVGCAQVPPQQVSDWDICRYTMHSGNNAMVAQREATRRGLDCRSLYPAIIARDQAQAQALQNAANYFNRPAPPMQTPINCSSYRTGNSVQTTCR